MKRTCQIRHRPHCQHLASPFLPQVVFTVHLHLSQIGQLFYLRHSSRIISRHRDCRKLHCPHIFFELLTCPLSLNYQIIIHSSVI